MLSVECHDINFSRGREKILSGISLKFEAGKFYGIFGPNGSGKSTLLKLLTGELAPDSGKVIPEWKNVPERARNIALLEQHIPPLLPLNVAETVALGLYPWKRNFYREEREKIISVLAESGLENIADRPYNHLSGGEKQRVMLARLLIQNTPVLFLDEPGSSLDAGFQHTFCSILRDLARKGKCIVMVSHDLYSAPLYLDFMILLGRGRIIKQGTPAELRNSPELRELFRLPEKSDPYLMA